MTDDSTPTEDTTPTGARPIDRARALRLIVATLTDDTDQFDLTVEEILTDEHQLHAVRAALAFTAQSAAAANARQYGAGRVLADLRKQILENVE
ncbi:hypothetical protein [Clavibacter zhangzhiyongii]|uniref:hypothetical protein n=1 Tax=Clavibacter zhangzhiyongii TaxID=2768071 RepID=UPI0039E04E55